MTHLTSGEILIIVHFLEDEYWRIRGFVDNNVPNWVNGDDSVSYPLLKMAEKLKVRMTE